MQRAPIRDLGFLNWLVDPPTDRGLRFADDSGDGWTFHSYEGLAGLARGAAGRLLAAGVEPGGVVPLVCPTSPTFVGAFLGALLIGATPCPVAPPTAYRARVSYLDHLSRLVRLVEARVVVTTGGVLDVVAEPLAALGCTVLADIADAPAYDGPVRPPEIGLVQFSSGATGPQRGVRVPFEALSANIDAIHRWLSYTRRDSFGTWLPLHHDMGLIGGVLVPMAAATDVWLMQPEQFIRSPLRWLRSFGTGGATTTTTPTFGLAHMLRKVRATDLTGMDFSGWRTLIVGAEPVDAAILDGVVRLLAPFGFDRRALLPAYGLAEATLAVTGKRHERDFRTLAVDGSALRLGDPVRLTGDATSGVTLVGCGPPVPGAVAAIVDEAGRPVGPGVLGEIEVRGPSLAAGYIGDGEDAGFGDRIRTGDAGFLRDGELFVLGRLGDSVKYLGRWLFAEELERVAVDLSPRPRRTVVLLGDLDGHTTAVVAMENEGEDVAETVGRAVFHHAAKAHVMVLSVPTGWISRTTSGKPRRREMWHRVLAGHPGGVVRWDSLRPVSS